MDYCAQLMQEHSRANADMIAKAIGNDPKELSKLVDILYNGEAPLPQRASWVLVIINEKYPSLLYHYVSKFINTINNFSVSGIRRNLLSALSKQQIDDRDAGQLTDYCFKLLLSAEEPVAVKVHAMQIIANIAVRYPELNEELKSVILDQESKNTVAFSARAKHLLDKMKKAERKIKNL